MKPASYCFLGAVLLACTSMRPHARAQAGSRRARSKRPTPTSTTRKRAPWPPAAVRHGGNAHAATSELYVLWRPLAAALDQPEEARTAFACALAANPELKLDRNLRPRSARPTSKPVLDVGQSATRPPLEATLRPHKQSSSRALRRLHVAASVVVSTERPAPRLSCVAASMPRRRGASRRRTALSCNFSCACSPLRQRAVRAWQRRRAQRPAERDHGQANAPASAREATRIPRLLRHVRSAGSFGRPPQAPSRPRCTCDARTPLASGRTDCERPGLIARRINAPAVNERGLRDERLAIRA